MRVLSSAALALGLAQSFVEAQGQFLVSDLSFGYTGRINDAGHQTVPGFSIQGTPDVPEILSNKLILTPPAPGNTRGAVWCDKSNKYKTWTADLDFRASGQERGSGNLNIWLVNRGLQDVGSASIYTVGKFDGLALVIDQHGGSGMIRGFLNDGSTDYKTHHSVDSLSFGHCPYVYRNLGRPSQIKFRQTSQSFKVEIDGRLCFESDKVSIPPGYNFGVTAAAADNPDSFELFKLVIMTENLEDQHHDTASYQQQDSSQVVYDRAGQRNNGNNNNQYNQNNNAKSDDPYANEIPDASADSITSSKAQFADLHNRLQSVNHHLSTIFRQVASQQSMGEKRHEEISAQVHDIKTLLNKLDKLDGLFNQVAALEREVRANKDQLAGAVRQTETSLRGHLTQSHGNMLEHVAEHTTPRHGKLIFIIVGSQFLIVGGYVVYERRKARSSKKYL